jgi:hypothetical protein
MIRFYCLMITLGNPERGAAEATDWMKPSGWTWNCWGRDVLREGDIVFRLGDARALRGTFPLSRFIAEATGSPFSHTGIVAVNGGSPVVYDCSSAGVQRQPLEV